MIYEEMADGLQRLQQEESDNQTAQYEYENDVICIYRKTVNLQQQIAKHSFSVNTTKKDAIFIGIIANKLIEIANNLYDITKKFKNIP